MLRFNSLHDARSFMIHNTPIYYGLLSLYEIFHQTILIKPGTHLKIKNDDYMENYLSSLNLIPSDFVITKQATKYLLDNIETTNDSLIHITLDKILLTYRQLVDILLDGGTHQNISYVLKTFLRNSDILKKSQVLLLPVNKVFDIMYEHYNITSEALQDIIYDNHIGEIIKDKFVTRTREFSLNYDEFGTLISIGGALIVDVVQLENNTVYIVDNMLLTERNLLKVAAY